MITRLVDKRGYVVVPVEIPFIAQGKIASVSDDAYECVDACARPSRSINYESHTSRAQDSNAGDR